MLKRHNSNNNEKLDNLYQTGNFFDSDYSKTEIRDQVKDEFYLILTHFLLDLNYTFNFFIYFFSGSRFREAFFLIFKKNVPISSKKPRLLTIKFLNKNNSSSKEPNCNLD